MINEELYGKAWRAVAKKEGHCQGVPPSPPQPNAGVTKKSKLRKNTAVKIRPLAAQGMTVPEIAKALGYARSTIRDICIRENIKAPNGVGSNPNPVKRGKQSAG